MKVLVATDKPFAADALPDAAAEEAAVELEAPPQAARAPAMPAAPATFRKLLREIFIRISSIFPSCFCDVEPSLSVCAHPFSDFIVSLFFKNKMENAGLSLGKNRHLKTLSVSLRSPAPPKGGALVLMRKYSTKPRPSGEVAVRQH